MKMIPDRELLKRFEKELNPQDLNASTVPAKIVGYGEISVIFEIESMPGIVFKRLPIFTSRNNAEKYSAMYIDYCGFLEEAGLFLPNSETCIVAEPSRPTVLYIAQEKLSPDRLAHALIKTVDKQDSSEIFEEIILELDKVWQFNVRHRPGLELAIDGQLSNWVMPENGDPHQPLYIDTSTPLFRIDGVEQQDPEPLLSSTPGFLRWIIRLLFLDEVMNRYYVPKLVYTDLAANLYKEQRTDLIPEAVEVINRALPPVIPPLTVSEVEEYYRGDKLIWLIFLRFRKIDRWLQTKIRRKRYEYILPGKIAR
jgi:hypothetical protein